MERIDLAEKLALIGEHWHPRVVGELNGQEVKLVKFYGTFVWHHHEHEDELFLGVRGRFRSSFATGPSRSALESSLSCRGASNDVQPPTRKLTSSSSNQLAARNTGNVEHPTLTAPTGVRV
jgi:hypothetical protein